MFMGQSSTYRWRIFYQVMFKIQNYWHFWVYSTVVAFSRPDKYDFIFYDVFKNKTAKMEALTFFSALNCGCIFNKYDFYTKIFDQDILN